MTPPARYKSRAPQNKTRAWWRVGDADWVPLGASEHGPFVALRGSPPTYPRAAAFLASSAARASASASAEGAKLEPSPALPT